MPDATRTAAFRVGRGIADITGEPSDCGMLGYGKADQRTTGIHLRLRARAFAFEDHADRCVLLVVAELPLMFSSVHQEVLRRLAATYGARYTATNVMLTATHTHCGPGGYSDHLLYNATTGGFHPQTFGAIVDGIVEAVARAHADLAPAEVTLGHGELHDASSNRSPSAFARNPAHERALFPGAIDPQTTLLRITRAGAAVGAVSWFATHGTSLTNRNTLISGDNKGYAAYHWERLVEQVDYLAEAAPHFVAAFAQTNTGDMSPNLNHRPGSGPTEDEFENARLIGQRQYDAAAGLAADPQPGIGEGVDARTVYVDLAHRTVSPAFTGDGRTHRTGAPIAGTAALAGTDEGAGLTVFRQGRNPWWDALSRPFYRLSPALRDAHAPKGLTVPGGLLNRVAPLVAEVLPVQLLRIGRLHLIGIPGEVTIVAGLRLRRTVAEILGADLRDVLVAGYANGYLHYVTTPEEYDEQRYEGGSTLFGRWQLPALQEVVSGLATALRDGQPVPAGPTPPDLAGRRRTRRRLPVDEPLEGHRFGDVLGEPRASYLPGERVEVTLVAGNLNHDLRRGSTYLEVQRETGDGWTRVADDGDWSTTLRRARPGRRTTTVALTWDIPRDAEPGDHRLRFHGSARSAAGRVSPFTSTTATFAVERPGR